MDRENISVEAFELKGAKVQLPKDEDLVRRLKLKLAEYAGRVAEYRLATPQASQAMAYIAPEVLEGRSVVIPHSMLNELLNSKTLGFDEFAELYPNDISTVSNAFKVIQDYVLNNGQNNLEGTGLPK